MGLYYTMEVCVKRDHQLEKAIQRTIKLCLEDINHLGFDTDMITARIQHFMQSDEINEKQLLSFLRRDHAHILETLFLGLLYQLGLYVQCNPLIARNFYHLAALKGNPFGEYLYGKYLRDNAELVNAAYWLAKAMEKGNTAATYELGLLNSNGVGVEKNPRNAFVLYRKAGQQGNIKAQFHLAQSFFENCGTIKISMNPFVPIWLHITEAIVVQEPLYGQFSNFIASIKAWKLLHIKIILLL